MSKLTLKDGPQDCCFLPEDCQYTCPEGSYPKYGKNCVNSFEDCQCEEGYTRQIRRETCHWDPSETDPKSEGKSEFSSEQDFRSACMGHGKQFCGPWRWWESECPEECVDVCRSDRGNDRRRNMLSYYDSRQYREWPGAWGIRRALATGYFDQAYLGTGNLRGKVRSRTHPRVVPKRKKLTSSSQRLVGDSAIFVLCFRCVLVRFRMNIVCPSLRGDQ